MLLLLLGFYLVEIACKNEGSQKNAERHVHLSSTMNRVESSRAALLK